MPNLSAARLPSLLPPAAGSSQANPFACVASGIAALWGPAHGGANEAVLKVGPLCRPPLAHGTCDLSQTAPPAVNCGYASQWLRCVRCQPIQCCPGMPTPHACPHPSHVSPTPGPH